MNQSIVTLTDLSLQQRVVLEQRLQDRRRAKQTSSVPVAVPSTSQDDENLVIAEARSSVDDILSKFYGRFPWPWAPKKFSYLADERFEAVMLSQDLGDWQHRLLPDQPTIWVAGCGANQALIVAMRFPFATVIGSDVSEKSLELCAKNAAMMNVTNLELRRESINQASYRQAFDFIVCTGVIHHNANPQETLEKLSAALKPAGVLELMVYNRFHRTLTSSFQKAIRIFGENSGEVDFESDIDLAKRIALKFPVENRLSALLKQSEDTPESDFADLFIQPVEHSYTVQSLSALAQNCGLEIAHPCSSPYVRDRSHTHLWNLTFDDQDVQMRYESLSDQQRWQITNLLAHERSPDLWFYFCREDSPQPRKSEGQLCAEFLDRRFMKAETRQLSYVCEKDGVYRFAPTSISYPLPPADPAMKRILEAVEPDLSMREVLQRAEVATNFTNINRARIDLTTSGAPYLRAI